MTLTTSLTLHLHHNSYITFSSWHPFIRGWQSASLNPILSLSLSIWDAKISQTMALIPTCEASKPGTSQRSSFILTEYKYRSIIILTYPILEDHSCRFPCVSSFVSSIKARFLMFLNLDFEYSRETVLPTKGCHISQGTPIYRQCPCTQNLGHNFENMCTRNLVYTNSGVHEIWNFEYTISNLLVEEGPKQHC
ncbi:hypothetical protein E3N88_15625 [Mikania micrantha]|uniref:Uncharacterized protein n=1 Tax=Mikania micrantha TaxID=192012 RepID=A0A5N6NZ53_9ASTR|nr:hypothetical protein E3N88_15625 [Mikania micrantha]